MDHASLEIGHEKLPTTRVKGNVAKCGCCVLAATEHDLRKDLRLVAVRGTQFPHRAGAASGTPHPGHPSRVIGVPVQAEG